MFVAFGHLSYLMGFFPLHRSLRFLRWNKHRPGEVWKATGSGASDLGLAFLGSLENMKKSKRPTVNTSNSLKGISSHAPPKSSQTKPFMILLAAAFVGCWAQAELPDAGSVSGGNWPWPQARDHEKGYLYLALSAAVGRSWGRLLPKKADEVQKPREYQMFQHLNVSSNHDSSQEPRLKYNLEALPKISQSGKLSFPNNGMRESRKPYKTLQYPIKLDNTL